MLTGHVFIATSLDGYIARRDGEIDWLMNRNSQGEGEDHGYYSFMADVDGIIMGRGTYEKVLTFPKWPYAGKVVVLTRSLFEADLPQKLRGRVSFSSEEPVALFQRLFSEGWGRAYVDGGKVIQSFLRAGLIEDMVITKIPVLIGAGLPLFGIVDTDILLKHVKTNSFPSGLVQSKYAVA